MIITAYHGTTLSYANRIKREGFNQSSNDTEWLGTGIYFYPNYNDAVDWSINHAHSEIPVVVYAIINVDDQEIIDFTDQNSFDAWNAFVERVLKDNISFNGTAEQNQCSFANTVAKRINNCKMMIGAFRKDKRKIRMLFDFRDIRKEYCIKEGFLVKKIGVIIGGEVQDD